MLPMKLELTEELAATLRQLRLDHPVNGEVLTAEKLSKAIGNNRAWMSQIESRRLKKIKREDIIKIYKLLFGYQDNQEAEDKAEMDLLSFLKNGENKLFFRYNNNVIDNVDMNKNADNVDDDLSNIEERLTKMYTENCSKIYDTLIELYNSKENINGKSTLTATVNNLLRLFDIALDDDSFLNVITSIPFDLYRFAKENEKEEIDKSITELTNTLNKLEHRKIVYSFVEHVEFISEVLSEKHLEIKNINDSIILSVMELSEILYKYPVIPMEIKVTAMNEFIKMLDLYSQKTSMIFTLTQIPEENCTIDDVNKALDYIQSFINGFKDSSAYLLNHLSSYYQEKL